MDYADDDFLLRAKARLRPLGGRSADDPQHSDECPDGGAQGVGERSAGGLLLRTLTQAAVLVPVIRRRSGLQLLLTVRSADMPTHAGQVAFPGGRMQAEDADLETTALREAEEEVALDRRRVDLIGRAPSYVTGSGFHITPVLGLIEDPGPIAPNPREVAEVFEAPLEYLMNPRHHVRQSREWQGRMRYYYEMPWQGRQIWGATAGMLRALYGALYAPASSG